MNQTKTLCSIKSRMFHSRIIAAFFLTWWLIRDEFYWSGWTIWGEKKCKTQNALSFILSISFWSRSFSSLEHHNRSDSCYCPPLPRKQMLKVLWLHFFQAIDQDQELKTRSIVNMTPRMNEKAVWWNGKLLNEDETINEDVSVHTKWLFWLQLQQALSLQYFTHLSAFKSR